MIEFDIRGDGTIVTLSEREFYQFVADLVVSYVDLAVQYIRLHMAGLADFDNTHFKSSLKIVQYQTNAIRTIIADETVQEELHTLVSCLLKLEEHDHQIVNAYADFYEVIDRNQTIDRKKLKSVVRQSRSRGSTLPEAVRELSKGSEDLLPVVESLKSSLIRKIKQLYSLEDSNS